MSVRTRSSALPNRVQRIAFTERLLVFVTMRVRRSNTEPRCVLSVSHRGGTSPSHCRIRCLIHGLGGGRERGRLRPMHAMPRTIMILAAAVVVAGAALAEQAQQPKQKTAAAAAPAQ